MEKECYIEDTTKLSNQDLIMIAKEEFENKNYKFGIACLNLAYLKGDPQAPYEISQCYKEGIVVEQNMIECHFYEEESAAREYLPALESYAKRLLTMSEKYVLVSRYFLRKAANQNSVFSILLYSAFCYLGKSDREAKKYFLKLNDLGFNINFYGNRTNELENILLKYDIDKYLDINKLFEVI